MRTTFSAIVIVALLIGLSSGALAGPVTGGNVVIYRVGTGSGSLVNTGNAVFIDEYTPTGTLVQSIPLPTTASGAQQQLIASGTATSEGLLSVSPNGQHIAVTGYGANLGGGSSLSGTSAPRTVGVISVSTGAVDTSTALTDFASGNNPRSAVTNDGNNLWVDGGAGGIRYTTLGSTTSTQLSTSATNLRQASIFDGQLYVSSGSGSLRVGTVGTGTPTAAGQTITNLPGFPTTGSPYAFYLADLSASVAGNDTLYVADDGAGLLKFSLVAGSWTASGTVGVAADAYRGVTGVVTGGNVTLFATRLGGSGATGGGQLVSLVDVSGYAGSLTGTIVNPLATAAANTAFRGVGLIAAVPEASSVVFLALASALTGGAALVRRKFAQGQ